MDNKNVNRVGLLFEPKNKQNFLQDGTLKNNSALW